MEMLRERWRSWFAYDWRFGLGLIFLFGVPRFILVLQAGVSGSYNQVFWVFMLMWFAPLIFLTSKGRRGIGLVWSRRYIRIISSFILGALACSAIFFLFGWLYGHSENNAFVYVGKVGKTANINESDRWIYFLVSAIPSMLFSPIGEEFLYRGVIHGSFAVRFGENRASLVDSLAFALTHLAHFGIVYSSVGWRFLPIPALLWVLSMFAVSRLFFRCRLWSGSIIGAVFAHAGFNLAMMYLVFFHL